MFGAYWLSINDYSIIELKCSVYEITMVIRELFCELLVNLFFKFLTGNLKPNSTLVLSSFWGVLGRGNIFLYLKL